MKRSSETKVKVKPEPGSHNTAQECAVAVKLETDMKEPHTPVKVKLEPQDPLDGRSVRVKLDTDAVGSGSGSSLLQQRQGAAIKVEALESPVQPRRRGSSSAATAAAAIEAAVKTEDAKLERIGYPCAAAAAAAAATASATASATAQSKHVPERNGDPEANHGVNDDEDDDDDEVSRVRVY